jgi:predicted RNA-binding Zn-ribbon protein involved in translation (DUF1610 family)
MMKHCPKCGSSRIRRGYAPDPLPLRLIGYRELLCDGCNLRFKGFVLPGMLPRSRRGTKERRKQQSRSRAVSSEQAQPLEARLSKSCPACGGEKTHRSHRRGNFERLASVILIYPHRCDDCNNRFLARREVRP